jgi:16S rRNA (guanine966-N2)-methyltransferase
MIKFDDAEGLRPTTDRIRETLFNWLQPYVSQSICLDAFAGSGALGFEVLSRGAAELVFFEQNKKTAENLRANIQQLEADTASVQQQDVLRWLAGGHGDKSFDLVFLDPPFHNTLLAEASRLLESSGCLAEDAIIYVEHAAGEPFAAPHNWICLKDKKAGQVRYKLFERHS